MSDLDRCGVVRWERPPAPVVRFDQPCEFKGTVSATDGSTWGCAKGKWVQVTGGRRG